jgi:site-specific recombinase XerD
MIRKKVSELVGRPIGPHMLRHTFASVLTDKGAHAFVVQHNHEPPAAGATTTSVV